MIDLKSSLTLPFISLSLCPALFVLLDWSNRNILDRRGEEYSGLLSITNGYRNESSSMYVDA